MNEKPPPLGMMTGISSKASGSFRAAGLIFAICYLRIYTNSNL